MESECKRYRHTARVALLSFEPQSDRWVMPAAAFSDTVSLPFAHTEIPVPVGFDAILTAAYGAEAIPRRTGLWARIRQIIEK